MIFEIDSVERYRPLLQDLDEGLINLLKKHNSHRKFALQISTRAPPEYILGSLPLAVQQGMLEVRHSVRPDYCA